jgi:hypothetical protein
MATKDKRSRSAKQSVKRSPRTEHVRTGDVVEPNRLYTYAEIAELYGGDVTERMVRGWVEARKIGFVIKPGGRGRRISGLQYLRAVEAGSVDPEEV